MMERVKVIRFKMFNKLKSIKNLNFKFLFEIFLTFFKISPFSFGGGFAMIPLFEKEIVERKKWIESEKMVELFAVSQSVPGAIAVNSATFIGYNLAGIPGAIFAAIGIVLPTFLIIIFLAVLLVSFQSNKYVQSAFKGIKPTVVALIAVAAYRMGIASIKDKISLIICILAGITLFIFKSINVVFLIAAGAFLGIAIMTVKKKIGNFQEKLKSKTVANKIKTESNNSASGNEQVLNGEKV